jgi:hypothetical protein
MKRPHLALLDMLDVEVANRRWSWGGTAPDGSRVLGVWQDEGHASGRIVATMVGWSVTQQAGGFDVFRRHFGVVCSYLVLLTALPNMFIAWCERGEEPEET